MPRIKDKTAPDVETFRSILKGKGLKATLQRIAVHEAMLNLGHASADMVVEKLSSEGVDVTVSSVYNILSTLADLKIYGRRTSSNNKMYFDVNTFRHFHLYNYVDNEYKDVIDDELANLIESHFKGRRFRGLKVDFIDVQIICRPSRTSRK
mgnify:FL=1